MRPIEQARALVKESHRVPRREVPAYRSKLHALLEQASEDASPQEHEQIWWMYVRDPFDVQCRWPIATHSELPERVRRAIADALFADVEADDGPEDRNTHP